MEPRSTQVRTISNKTNKILSSKRFKTVVIYKAEFKEPLNLPETNSPAAIVVLERSLPEAIPSNDLRMDMGNENPLRVYKLGDDPPEERVSMKYLGLDIGTKTIVLAYKGKNGKPEFISEINGYYIFERASAFIENMLNDPSKVRSDGEKRPAKWIKLPDSDKIAVLGSDAEEWAYANNDAMMRPMAEGGITSNEDAMIVLSSIIQGMLDMAENDLGQWAEEVKLCYCTTAPALNKDLNMDYHKRVVDLIISGYESKSKLKTESVKESHAIVINESPDATGIGISWGAGTVTVSYVKFGLEVYSFCWVGSGDWIDEQVAIRHGYDPLYSKARRRVAKETPTTVAKRKHTIDLTPGKEPTDRIGLDVLLHYQVLISKVVNGIITGFLEHESDARIDGAVNVYMAGGTCIPDGFEDRVRAAFNDVQDMPFEVAQILKSKTPLFSVATGCLKAAEMF